MIGQRSLVTAHGETHSITAWGKRSECFVKTHTLFQRIRSLGTDNPDPIDVEAALCFTQRLWIFYRKHGYIIEELIDTIPDPEEEPGSHNFNTVELAERIRELSPQQRHVLILKHRGHRTAAIAYVTNIGSSTVKRYVEHLLEHLGLVDFDDWRLSEPEVQLVFSDHIGFHVSENRS